MRQVSIPPPQASQNKPLSQLSTLGIGGPAKFYIEVRQIEEMRAALLFCKEHALSFFILGKGSNCLFDDRGFNGCIIHNKIDFMTALPSNTFHVGAGYSFSLLGTKTAKLGFKGLEFASGIPASVGGAIYMNAGASLAETKDPLVSVDFMDENGIITTFYKEDLCFKYRYSPFQKMKGVIISAVFTLETDLEARSKQMSLLNYRKKTQPYSDKSAGCVFRNPEGNIAGALIERCGLKELAVGGAKVSSLHANFLINADAATAQNFKELIHLIQRKVKEQTPYDLECEIRVIPYEL